MSTAAKHLFTERSGRGKGCDAIKRRGAGLKLKWNWLTTYKGERPKPNQISIAAFGCYTLVVSYDYTHYEAEIRVGGWSDGYTIEECSPDMGHSPILNRVDAQVAAEDILYHWLLKHSHLTKRFCSARYRQR